MPRLRRWCFVMVTRRSCGGLVRSSSMRAGLAQRARIVLLAAEAVAKQEQYLLCTTLEEKWEAATEWSYTGIELRAQGHLAFEARLPELRRARSNA